MISTLADPWEIAARSFEPTPAPDARRWPTPGHLARELDPRTVQTPALDLIDAALVELMDTPNARLIITMPPQEGKSTRVAKDFPVWALTQQPDWRIVGASYGQSLANRNGLAVRRLIERPEVDLEVAHDNGAASDWTLAGHDGGLFSVGTGGPVTGRPCDCVSGDTHIDSEHGTITAAEAFARGITRIRAYDHTTGRAVWRDVEAARRIPGRRVVEVVTTGGRVLTCTPDHRVYTGRGYVAARDLQAGDTLVGLGAGRVRLRQPARGAEVRTPQSDSAGGEDVLLTVMRAGGDVAHAAAALLRRVWGGSPAPQGADVLEGLRAETQGRPQASEDVPAVWRRVHTEVVSDGLLLSALRGRRTLGPDGRSRELALHDREVLRPMVPVDEAAHPGARRTPLRGLRRGTYLDLHSEREEGHALRSGSAPHQREGGGQSSAEPDHAVPDMPRRAPQVEGDTVAVVRSRGDEEISVYDFQVEGTRNFFADGLLVHNCLIIDDPIKSRAEADSKVYRDRVWDWWTDEASSRFGAETRAVLILTRWHHDDLAGRLLAEEGSPWKVLNIPAQADHRPEHGESDPLGREPGEFMVSTRGRDQKNWELRKKTAGTRTWASLFQGHPTPDSGNLFPVDGWARYERPLWIVRDDGARVIPEANSDPDYELVQSWDFAFKDTKQSDYVVGQVWLRRGNKAYLLDMVRERAGFRRSCQMIREMSARWPQATAKLVEDKANGPAILNSLRHELSGLIPVEPEGSKYARAVAITPLTEAKDVVLPDSDLCPWVTDLTEEARNFPQATHDDTVDCLSQAVHRLLLVPILAGQTYTETDLMPDLEELDWSVSLY